MKFKYNTRLALIALAICFVGVNPHRRRASLNATAIRRRRCSRSAPPATATASAMT